MKPDKPLESHGKPIVDTSDPSVVVIKTKGGEKARQISAAIEADAQVLAVKDSIEALGLDAYLEETLKDLPATQRLIKALYVRLTALEAKVERLYAGK